MTCSQPHEGWTWVATYADGSTLRECPGDGQPHRGKKHIDQHQVVEIAWEIEPNAAGGAAMLESGAQTQSPEGEAPTERVSIRKPDLPDAKLTLARRRHIVVDFDTGTVRRPTPILMLGWETPDDQQYLFVLPDGTTRVSKDLNAV